MKSRKKAWKSLVGTVGATALLLTACGDDEGGEDNGAQDIAVVLKTTTSPYWLQVQGGVEDAAEEHGVNVTVGGATEETAVQEQIDRIRADLTNQPDVLVVSPTQAEQLEPVLQSAADEGTPVVLLDTNIEGWDAAETFIGTDNWDLGEAVGDYLLEEVGSGQTLFIRGVPGNPTTDARIDGAQEVLEGSDFEMVAELSANSDRAEARNSTADALQANEDLDVIFAANDDMALGAIEAIRGAGLDLDDFYIIGVDGTGDAVDSILNGELDATMAQGAYEMGARSIEEAIRVAEGEELEGEIAVETTLVTEENAEEFAQSLEDQSAE